MSEDSNDRILGRLEGKVDSQNDSLERMMKAIESLASSHNDTNRTVVDMSRRLEELAGKKLDRSECKTCGEKYLTKRDFATATGAIGTAGAIIAWVLGVFVPK